MTIRDRKIQAISEQAASSIKLLEDLKDGIEKMIQGFCEAHTQDMVQEPLGDDGTILRKRLSSCCITVAKEYRTKFKVQYDKPDATEA
jgi:phage host-nuclease inhibitor protein Gam